MYYNYYIMCIDFISVQTPHVTHAQHLATVRTQNTLEL